LKYFFYAQNNETNQLYRKNTVAFQENDAIYNIKLYNFFKKAVFSLYQFICFIILYIKVLNYNQKMN